MIAARPWTGQTPPARVLAIRLQATGDVAITLPYLRALARVLPHARIDFVTRADLAELARAVRVFDRVHALGGGWSERRQLVATLTAIPRLAMRRYDVVIDLQNNRVSRTIRRALAPRGWSAFDRWSARSAGERTKRTIEALGFQLPEIEPALPLADERLGLDVLARAGWDPSRDLVVLSPAGAFVTRNWPVERYAEFAAIWAARHPQTQFAVVGLASLRATANALESVLGQQLINLAGGTTLAQALGVVQRAALVVAEDCGLMHMAWTSGVPTLALFGSSRHVWSAPLGAHTRCLHSGDLPCGACMEPTCRFGDVHCLTRYTAEQVAGEAEALFQSFPRSGGGMVREAGAFQADATG